MSDVAAAFLAGMLTGAAMAVPFTLLLAYVLIPRAVDLWTVVVRRVPRSHGR